MRTMAKKYTSDSPQAQLELLFWVSLTADRLSRSVSSPARAPATAAPAGPRIRLRGAARARARPRGRNLRRVVAIWQAFPALFAI